MLDSLVRVSRRGKENHFVSITSAKRLTSVFPGRRGAYSTVRSTPAPPYDPRQTMLTHARSQRPCRKQQEKYKRARHWFPSLPFQQFQVLFNSLFKVLCIFPSRYLYAIGLPPIFSFRWNLPPTLSCNPKQLDSLKAHAKAVATQARTGVSPSQLPFSKGLGPERPPSYLFRPQFGHPTELPDSHGELFPLQSPLLGESLLVSFPPLNYMLKFSG